MSIDPGEGDEKFAELVVSLDLEMQAEMGKLKEKMPDLVD